MSVQRSIVICGGAFAGLALAVALRQGLGADIPIIVADPALGTRPSRDPRATAVTSYDSRSDGIDVTLADGSVIEASLLVAADGARSKLRERAGIATHGWDYDQSGIVVTVGHERDHHGRAEEHFLPAGPFAILPLKGARSSLVWTENRAEAARIVALSGDEFHGELERRFGLHLGEVKALDKPRAFPLSYFVARAFIGERLALVGDAAHVIH